MSKKIVKVADGRYEFIRDDLTVENEKIALLELTPRSIKLELAVYAPNVSFEVYDQFILPLNIYEDINRDGFIKPTQISEVVKKTKMLRKVCDSYGITKATAYATSNFRDAKNYYGFLEELEIASGFKIRLLQEQDELVSIYNSVINTMDEPKGIAIYIGDEVTYFLHYSRKNILNQATISFGTENLSELFLENPGQPEEQMAQMADLILNELRTNITWLSELDMAETSVVGMGDVIINLGKISKRGRKYPLDLLHALEISKQDFTNVYNAIKVLDMDKRSKIKGITDKSAGSIASGLAIMQAVFDVTKMEKFSIANVDMSTGILFNQCVPLTLEKPISDVVLYSLTANTRYHQTNANNMYNVCELSMLLYRQLRVMHKLGRPYIRPLRIAGFMFDVGSRMRFNPTRKDALNVILNTTIYGASHKDIVLAAFIASSQNLDEFSLSDWVKFKDIVNEEDLQAVKKLAVLLKIAVALDRTEQNKVKDIVCDVLGDSVIMKTITEPGQDLCFELECAKEATIDFKRVYGKNLELL